MKESKSEISMKIETMNSTKEMKMDKTFQEKSQNSKRSSFKSLNDHDYIEVKNLGKKEKSRSSLAVVAPDVHQSHEHKGRILSSKNARLSQMSKNASRGKNQFMNQSPYMPKGLQSKPVKEIVDKRDTKELGSSFSQRSRKSVVERGYSSKSRKIREVYG